MTILDTDKQISQLDIKKEIQIAAPAEIVWKTILAGVGPLESLNLKIEAWPGGRWYRDLGHNAGHFWGHVQVIKPPKLLEICGPMMMSYPVASFIQYRLTEKDGGTLLTFVHQAFGMLTAEVREGVNKGWQQTLDAIRDAAQKSVR
jgi:uncharacterized protein YndB with AHSA1/START domain